MTSSKSRWDVLGPPAALVAVFILSRVAYYAAGVRFDATPYSAYWQYIDPHLLGTDLWRSVAVLHTQPPLMNLVLGILLGALPADFPAAFHLLYMLAGLGMAIAMFSAGIWLRLPAWISALLAAWFSVSPATVLYENWLFYAYPVLVGLTVGSAAFFRYVATGKLRWAVLFFGILATLALTWSLYHLAWLLVVLGLTLAVGPNRRKTQVASAIPILIVALWYGKNLWIARTFTANSWAGMNLSRVTTFCLSPDDRELMVKRGELSAFAAYPPFRNPEVYLGLLPDTPTTGVPLLDEIYTSLNDRNRHHLVYARASHYYLRDALHVIARRPGVYLNCVAMSGFIAFHSPTDYERVLENRQHIQGFDLWWNRLFYGQWNTDIGLYDQRPDKSVQHVAWWSIAIYLAAVVGGLRLLWKDRAAPRDPAVAWTAFAVFNILYTVLIGTFTDLGENNRFRYTVDPLALMLVSHIVQRQLQAASGSTGSLESE